MSRIEVLDKNTIDRIAAGEVVERPASVAKELIENAVDAKAGAITVEIKNGGIDFLRVTDNGCGIPANEVRTAFLRHATSKLKSIEDLYAISSLGFRGEALSSIAAVSQVEFITRDRDSVTGVRYVLEGGAERSFEEIGAPYGTTFVMRHLFFNTPARAKFLKSASSEQNAVTAYVEQLALSHPDISFKYIINGSVRLHTTGNGNLREAVYSVYGKEAARHLISIDKKYEHVSIDGFLGDAAFSRGNRNFEVYFVNGRYVKDKALSAAIEEGYSGNLMQRRYPFVVLNFAVDKEKVDVNVHPAKLEIRFSKQKEICDEVAKGVREALLEGASVQKASIEPARFRQISPVVETQINSEPAYAGTKTETKIEKKPDIPEPFEQNRLEAGIRVPELVAEKQAAFELDKLTRGRLRTQRVIGQVFETYILLESDGKFYIVDQHAAHEKVMYERFMEKERDRKIVSQRLMPAIIVTLSLVEASALMAHIDAFTRFGFEIEAFGGREFKITAVPAELAGADAEEFFKEILDLLGDDSLKEPGRIKEKIALKACKAAVKANRRLSDAEIERLMEDLFSLEDPYHCPHGRPTVISFSRYDLDKKFKRIV